MNKYTLLLPLLLMACDNEPAVRDDGLQVLVVDERIEDDRMTRSIELIEPGADDLVSLPPEPTSACVCTGCRGACRPGGGSCLQCWSDNPYVNCCDPCYEGLPKCDEVLILE